MENLDDFVSYDHLLIEPLKKYGWRVETAPWRLKNILWDQFDAVIVRSPWDYHHDPDSFIKTLERIDTSTAHLENSLRLMRWNIEKHYLRDLQNREIPIVPTRWLPQFSTSKIHSCFEFFDASRIVIKPVVGAGADDTFWITPQTPQDKLQKMQELFALRPIMVQPFMENITREGEFSLFYFDGSYSHTILKTPESGDFRVQEEHGGRLKLAQAGQTLKQTGRGIMQALPEIPLYARVDVVRTEGNHFALMELELIEPSLYFNMDAKSPLRFARAFNRRMEKISEEVEKSEG
jgi:glutathione synthase/RimK-type ligase-like ATP-grasp enzyme